MDFVFFLLRGLSFLIVVDALSSWIVPGRDRFPRNILGHITEPLYRPVRRIFDPGRFGGIDFSPLVVLLTLQVAAGLLARSIH
ncbi:MAG: YggT family protein [Deltaproteobacteria bacterium]|nr:YggT family protein [Deltaproteobacteria bacterium]